MTVRTRFTPTSRPLLRKLRLTAWTLTTMLQISSKDLQSLKSQRWALREKRLWKSQLTFILHPISDSSKQTRKSWKWLSQTNSPSSSRLSWSVESRYSSHSVLHSTEMWSSLCTTTFHCNWHWSSAHFCFTSDVFQEPNRVFTWWNSLCAIQRSLLTHILLSSLGSSKYQWCGLLRPSTSWKLLKERQHKSWSPHTLDSSPLSIFHQFTLDQSITCQSKVRSEQLLPLSQESKRTDQSKRKWSDTHSLMQFTSFTDGSSTLSTFTSSHSQLFLSHWQQCFSWRKLCEESKIQDI